jgi:DNA recombination protein RmuC
MNIPTVIGAIGLFLLGMILWRTWKLVRSPLPPEMQAELEERYDKKQQAKLDRLRDDLLRHQSEDFQKLLSLVQTQFQTTEKTVSDKLQQTNDTFSRVSRQVGELTAATQKFEEVGRSVASLQDLLKAPKMRGGMGEHLLKELLEQIMPGDFYSLQYGFSDGERVDAVIRLGGRLVPVDAKFPLEQFVKMNKAVTEQERTDCRKGLIRDVKGHIDAIADKYIRPAEGTFEFALMYIPAESVYYEAVIKDDGIGDERGIFHHAVAKKVIPVSPNSFYAYLQVILQGLKGFAVEERAKEILAALNGLGKELSGLRVDFDLVGKQLNNAAQNFEKAEKHLSRFENKLKAVEAPEKVEELSLEGETSLKEI